MKIYLFIFLSFQICTGEIIKSDKWSCHYRCYRSHFPANDRRGTSYRTQRSIMTTHHRARQCVLRTFLKHDVVAFPVLRTCNLALVWQTTLPSLQLSRISQIWTSVFRLHMVSIKARAAFETKTNDPITKLISSNLRLSRNVSSSSCQCTLAVESTKALFDVTHYNYSFHCFILYHSFHYFILSFLVDCNSSGKIEFLRVFSRGSTMFSSWHMN